MIKYVPRDDKFREVFCRAVLFTILYLIASHFGDGFTLAEGIIVYMLTGVEYDTTVMLNHSRFRLNNGSMP